MKNGVNQGNGFAVVDANTKNLPLNCLILKTIEESFTFVTFKKEVCIKWNLIYSRISFRGQRLLFK